MKTLKFLATLTLGFSIGELAILWRQDNRNISFWQFLMNYPADNKADFDAATEAGALLLSDPAEATKILKELAFPNRTK